MIERFLRVKAVLLVATAIVGCAPAPSPPPLRASRKPSAQKPLTDNIRLLGVWRHTKGSGFEILIFNQGALGDGNFVRRWSSQDFRKGYIEEAGIWDIDRGRLNLAPQQIRNRPVAGNPAQLAEYKHYRKVADEGAWKPASTTIKFLSDNAFVRTDHQKREAVFERATPSRSRSGATALPLQLD